jgi:hypothetical protein
MSDNKESSSLYLKIHNLIENKARDYGLYILPGGEWANMSVWRATKSEWNGTGFQVFKPADFNNPGHVVAMRTLFSSSDFVADLNDDLRAAILKNVTDTPTDQNGAVSKALSGRYMNPDYSKMIGEIGDGIKLICRPPLAKTGTSVSDAAMNWLPESERRILMLTIGRLFSNREGHWRLTPIINGAPGIGKSTFLHKLIDTAAKLGVVTGFVQSPLGKFSLTRNLLRSNLLVTDDTVTSDIKVLATNSVFKSMVSGTGTVIEEKFKAPVTVHPDIVYVMLANQILAGDLIGADPGMLNRVKILKINQTDKDFDIPKHIANTASSLGVSVERVYEMIIEECHLLYQTESSQMTIVQSVKYHCTNLVTHHSNHGIAEVSAMMIWLTAKALELKGTQLDVPTFSELCHTWNFNFGIYLAERDCFTFPPSFYEVFEEIDINVTKMNVQRLMMSAKEPDVKSFVACFHSKSGYKLPTTLVPYYKALEPEYVQMSTYAKVLKALVSALGSKSVIESNHWFN